MASRKKPGFNGVRDPSITWTRRGTAEMDLSGRTALVVGGTGGLGQALARRMAARGARVTVVGRTFRDEGTPGLEFVRADLESLAEALRVGATVPVDGLDVVVLTTGIFAAPERQETAEGVERDLAVSYLSRLALLRSLAPRLPPGRTRVFVMGFPGTGADADVDDLNSERSYRPMPAHMATVAGNEALVLHATRAWPHARFYGLNPGLVKTGIRSNFLGEGSLKHRLAEALIGLFTASPDTYAERTVPLLFAPELDAAPGAMFNARGHAIRPTESLTADRVAALIRASDALVDRALQRAADGGASAASR